MENHVTLKILSNKYNADEISAIVGIECDGSWNKGDLRKHTIIKEKKNGWVLQSRQDSQSPLEQHISSLLSRAKPVADKIKKFSEDSTVELSCAIYDTAAPALYFEKEVMRAIENLGASLDIDLYILEE